MEATNNNKRKRRVTSEYVKVPANSC